MDTHTDHHSIHITKPQLWPPPSPPPEASFPILAISIVGILATAILLLTYYIFVIKCCLSWHHSDVLRRLSRSRRRWLSNNGHTLSSLYLSTITVHRGLDESAIQAIPTLRFRRGEQQQQQQQQSFHECAVCLNEFQDEERIRMLPNCFHVFHIDCIDTWLQTHANCPLCRAGITSTIPIPLIQQNNLDQGVENVVIDVQRDQSSDHTPRSEANPTTTNSGVGRERKKLHKVSSMGDECIDTRGKLDEQFAVQPMRRSFSMDSSTDRQLYMAVQEILRQNPHFREAGINGEGTSTGAGRTRRSFFSFGGHCRAYKEYCSSNPPK